MLKERHCLLILGNGFDLHLEYKSSYRNFIEHLEEKQNNYTLKMFAFLEESIQELWGNILGSQKFIELWGIEDKKELFKNFDDFIMAEKNHPFLLKKDDFDIFMGKFNKIEKKQYQSIYEDYALYKSIVIRNSIEIEILNESLREWKIKQLDTISNKESIIYHEVETLLGSYKDLHDPLFYLAEMLFIRMVNDEIDKRSIMRRYRNYETDVNIFWFDNLWYQYFKKKLNHETNWIDVEEEFSKIIRLLFEIREEEQDIIMFDDHILFDKKYKELFEFLCIPYVLDKTNKLKIASLKTMDSSNILVKKQNKQTVLDIEKTVQIMNADFVSIRKELQEYIKIQSDFKPEKENEKIEKLKKQFKDFSEIDVINFNYNHNIYKLKTTNDIKSHNVHGSVEEGNNDIILGHNDIHERKFAQFKKENHRLTRTNIPKGGTPIKTTLCILGHSLAKNDFPIIKEYIINLKCKIKKIKYFYYNEDDKFEKAHGLQELFEYLEMDNNLQIFKTSNDIEAIKL